MKQKRKTQLEKRRTNKTISDQIREAERRNNKIIETWEQERTENTGQKKRRRGAEK